MFVLKKLRSIISKHDRGNAKSNTGNITDVYPVRDEIQNERAMDNIILPFEIEECNEVREIEDEELSVPSIYVDANLVRQIEINSYNEKEREREGTVYVIDGNIFWDDRNVKPNDLLEFEIKEHNISHDGDLMKEREVQGLEGDVEETQVNKDESLQIAIENTSYGLMINSIILLTENAWNTIVCGDITICIVCGRSLDIREIAGHIATDDHRCTLDKFKPLKEFDINIVRKINDKYHCAVCNIIFDIGDINHVESAPHGEKVLKALNKASDVTDYDNDFDVSRNDNRNVDNDSIYHDTAEDSSGIDMQSFDGFYDDVSVSYCSDDDKDINQESTFSYADIAKKPKAYTIPKYVQIKLGDNYAKVKFDSWHMVIVLKTNNYYCMACKENGPIRFKSEHCLKVSHVEKLMKCNIVREYKEHVIRKVDDKLYHCGHCNNLHMIHEIRDHIERNHIRAGNMNLIEKTPLTKCTVIRSASHSPKVNNPKNVPKSTTPSHIANNDHIVHIANNDLTVGNISNDNNNLTTSNVIVTTQYAAENLTEDNRNRNNEKHNPLAFVPYQVPNVQPCRYEMDSVIIITEFGQTYYLSLLAYNTIQQRRPNAYFCWVCDVWCINVRNHISDRIHVTRLAQTPFLSATSFHLIRQTKYGIHCAACNILLQQNPIHHTWEQMHLFLLNKAIYKPSIPNSVVGTPISCQNYPVSNTPIIKTPEIEKMTENEQKIGVTTDSGKNTDNEKNTNNHKNTGNLKNTAKLKNTENGKNTDNEHDMAHNEKIQVKTTDKDFDPEEYLYVKLKYIYTKITMTSYNTLVQCGTGTRHCVLCSADVFFDDLKAHINNKDHLKNLDKCNFLRKYERHLIRQTSTRYHCALCNVWVIKGSINEHISWPTHKEIEGSKIVKHIRRNEIKLGITVIPCSTQDEIVDSNTKNDFEIIANIEFRLSENQDIVKTNRIVKIDGVVLKISWDSYHGICKQKNGYKCLICQTDFKNFGLSAHIESSRHMQVLEDCFLLEFSPALIRKVNPSTLHCLTCNTEVNNTNHSIKDHIASKGHIKKYKSTVADKIDSDIDSNDILTLTR